MSGRAPPRWLQCAAVFAAALASMATSMRPPPFISQAVATPHQIGCAELVPLVMRADAVITVRLELYNPTTEACELLIRAARVEQAIAIFAEPLQEPTLSLGPRGRQRVELEFIGGSAAARMVHGWARLDLGLTVDGVEYPPAALPVMIDNYAVHHLPRLPWP